MKQMFKATIFGTVIQMYRRKKGTDSITFDSIMEGCRVNKRGPGRELIDILRTVTGIQNQKDLFGYIKDKAIEDFGDWPRNLQETIWSLLRPF